MVEVFTKQNPQLPGENNPCQSLETFLAGFFTPLLFCVWIKQTAFFLFVFLFSYPVVTVRKASVHLGKHSFAKHLIFSFASFQFCILKLFPIIVHLALSDILALVARHFASSFIM